MNPAEVTPRNGPLILSMPHGGTDLPEDIRQRLNAEGRVLHDTDWWIYRLYNFADALDATVVRTTVSRYVIDVNRDPQDAPLYPGQATTGLCPTVTFDGAPLYTAGQEPDEDEIAQRRRQWFAPYHQALSEQIERVKAQHGYALLYDCHSIRSTVPRLFEGELPALNIGTNNSQSCAPEIEQAVAGIASKSPFSHVVNGRFRGGWITRHYGRPEQGVHVVQMELAQHTYMQESPPYPFIEARAAEVRPVLHAICSAIAQFRPGG
ncbi:MAG: N-formylglutamate deformylase [Aquisalimonadaceae bacterium]